MEIRQAFPNEVDVVMAVLSSPSNFLAESGSSQWQGENGYPNEDDVFDDILQGHGLCGGCWWTNCGLCCSH